MRLITIFFILTFRIAFGQYPDMKSYFTTEEITLSNTAVSCTYLSLEEKNMITWLNLARINPSKFHEVITYYSTIKYGPKYKTNSYVKSLLATLTKMKPIAVLTPNVELYDLAFCWAKEAGVKGYIGHARKKCKYGYLAECCSYNSKNDGFYQIYQLLVDEGVKNLGHRKTMLSAEYTLIGVSIQPHKKYGTNAVLDFK